VITVKKAKPSPVSWEAGVARVNTPTKNAPAIWPKLTVDIRNGLKMGLSSNVTQNLERGTQGFSKQDVMNTDKYLANLIVTMVKQVRDITADVDTERDAAYDAIIEGFAAYLELWDEGKSDDVAPELWDKIDKGFAALQEWFVTLWY
jgi:hypothetical protein